MARLAQAFQQVNYHPQVPYYGAQAYGQQFLDLAGGAAEGTTIAVTHVLFDESGSVPEMQNFVDWYGRVAPGSKPPWGTIATPVPARESCTARGTSSGVGPCFWRRMFPAVTVAASSRALAVICNVVPSGTPCAPSGGWTIAVVVVPSRAIGSVIS